MHHVREAEGRIKIRGGRRTTGTPEGLDALYATASFVDIPTALEFDLDVARASLA